MANFCHRGPDSCGTAAHGHIGSDRKSIGKIFAEWKWQARPLQLAKQINGGVMWLIQSVAGPPKKAVHNMHHGQIVISKCDSL